jgi:hypothetical protein
VEERPAFPWLGLVVRLVVGFVLALVQTAVIVGLVALVAWGLFGRRR